MVESGVQSAWNGYHHKSGMLNSTDKSNFVQCNAVLYLPGFFKDGNSEDYEFRVEINLAADPGEGFFAGGSACLDSGGDQQDFVVAVSSTHHEHFYATESGLLDRCSDQSDKDTTNLDS